LRPFRPTILPSATALNSFQANLPGQFGNRNSLRGDGFAGLDLGLTKRWRLPWKESHALQLRWDVFNALNLTRFDVQSLSRSLANTRSFRNYIRRLTNTRVIEVFLCVTNSARSQPPFIPVRGENPPAFFLLIPSQSLIDTRVGLVLKLSYA